MPNHIQNIVKMAGICKLPVFTEKDGTKCFDFEKIIPMPKSLDVASGSIEDIAIEAIMRIMSGSGFMGRSYKSMNDEEYARRRRAYDGDDTSLLELGLKYITNKVRYGTTTWYDWCIDNWGTKWNAYDNMQDGDDIIKFQTAWNAPERVMLRLSEMYPDEIIEHWWADEDTACNTGYQVYKGGTIIAGGPYENQSNEAYENYVFCRGENKCLYKDENGKWHQHDCDTCSLCD